MGAPCRPCNHPRLAEIDRDLVAGKARAAISRKYGLTADSLRRHEQAHITEEMRREIALELRKDRAVAVADELNEGDVEIDASMKRILREIDALLKRAVADNNDPLALLSLKEMRATLMDLAKLTGSLQRELTVTVNLNESPQFITLRQMILRVLERHPEAKADFLGEMRRLQIGHG